jgi:hypothetical protein
VTYRLAKPIRMQRVLTAIGAWIVGVEEQRYGSERFVAYAVRSGDPFAIARRDPSAWDHDLRRARGATVPDVLSKLRRELA